jgi:hypothetical protein
VDSDAVHTLNENERKRTALRLQGFAIRDSRVWRVITDSFGIYLSQAELLSIAEVLGLRLNLKVDRGAKRRKEVLIKWYEENWDRIPPVWHELALEDDQGRRLYAIRQTLVEEGEPIC